LTEEMPSPEHLLRAADAGQADNPFAVVNYRDLAKAVAQSTAALTVRHPDVLAWQLLRSSLDLAAVAAGRSDLAPEPEDHRFDDPAWDTSVFRRLMQSYLVCRAGAHSLVDQSGLEPPNLDRARFGITLLTEALSPSNTVALNPVVLRRALKTRGASLVRGTRNALIDAKRNGGMPSQVDPRPFELGRNVAATRGAVIHRTPMYELLQYMPATREVTGAPLLIVPSQVNKYYIVDLAPGRSMVEYLVSQGSPTYAISWRNPGREHADWDLESYIAACLEASEVAMSVSGTEMIHFAGICAGGIMVAILLAYLMVIGDQRAATGTLMVTHLDQAVDTIARVFVADPVVEAAKRRSRREGFLNGRDTARFFAWLRPNELVWSYVVNNWLLGEDPPKHELLFWNVDNTRLPAELHSDYLDLYVNNPLPQPGGLRILGEPIDVGTIQADTYLVAGTTDHITPWRGCFRSARLIGGTSDFTLAVNGHVGAIVSSPGARRGSYFAGRVTSEDPDEWVTGAEQRKGSWWPHWTEWLHSRSGPAKRAPRRLGSRKYPPGDSAPGAYVR
jgi:polyhydroxyalkanoate synthase subunit PhaC